MAGYERWDDFLIAEHEMIERAMSVLKTNLDKIDSGDYDSLQMQRAVDFLLEFGDKVHNQKEEGFLFPLMQERGIPIEGGPLGVMVMEHDAERRLLQHMSTQVDTLDTAGPEVIAKFKKEGLEYLVIRAEHIWKENDILYPMARNVMQEGDGEKMMAEFARLNLETYGQNAWEKFSAMVSEIEGGRENRTKLIKGLSYEQLDAIMETLPFEVTFVDAEDTVAYFNRLDKEKIFPRTRSVIGRKVGKCHPEKSVKMVGQIVDGFKNRTLDKAEFWINFRDEKVLIRYFPVYSDSDEYMGVVEVTQEIDWIQKLEGEKRLMD
ncbi:MAG: PAS domain-containing protein [Thermodesulfobacteriota bacterium]